MSLPSTIGRYRVVGHLASGGMAEIFLGKIFGPSGFEQAVVIKRILPHLARQETFVSMFLDEARIVAGIRHPNVVRVQELAREGEDLFLVMEYLEGESAQGLMRRMTSQRRTLPFELAAYVAAEACAALHAAHSLKDPDGNDQHLVHRDVSPQNIFVTYSGEVKLLDFGVAKAADRITRTEAGQVKGKFGYMSPEQCLGRAVDRRSDVFSLGIVLYELTTGRRLFARATEMLTMRALTELPIPRPSESVPGYPAALEEICMRALARDPDERYQSAAEMRRDLLITMRELRPDLLPEHELSEVMHAMFGERIAEKQELLRKVRAGSEITHVPAADVDLEIEMPSAVVEVEVEVEEPRGARVADALPTPSSRPLPVRRPFATIGAALAGAAIAALVAWVVAGMDDEIPRPALMNGAPHGAASAKSTVREDAPPAPAEVTMHVETRPPGGFVWIDGEPRGFAPVDLRVRRGARAHEIIARKNGYRGARERVTAEQDRDVTLTLTKRRRTARVAEAESDEPRIRRFQ